MDHKDTGTLGHETQLWGQWVIVHTMMSVILTHVLYQELVEVWGLLF